MTIEERRRREREARRKAVLDAARDLVRERGYNGTTTKEIAKACDLSEATVFFYFRSKDEIFTALLLEGIGFMQDQVAQIAAAELPPRELIRRLWGSFAELAGTHPEYFHVFAALANPDATTSVSDELRDEIARLSGDNFRRVADLLRPAVGDHRAREVADLLWASFAGLSVLRASRVNLGAAAHPTPAELDDAAELLVSGVLPS
ncbi:MAG: TetR/AcrR family transcriptional regulator [Acidimicrobiia bacterium]|nr:TetR/AcrR family transcriptional regulator [Acidimicrobiia bacterium]